SREVGRTRPDFYWICAAPQPYDELVVRDLRFRTLEGNPLIVDRNPSSVHSDLVRSIFTIRSPGVVINNLHIDPPVDQRLQCSQDWRGGEIIRQGGGAGARVR